MFPSSLIEIGLRLGEKGITIDTITIEVVVVDWGFAKGEVLVDEIKVGAALGWLITINVTQDNFDNKLRYKEK